MGKRTHQTADRTVLTKRNQRANITIYPALQRSPPNMPNGRFGKMIRLLMSRPATANDDYSMRSPLTGPADLLHRELA